jgi:hypothetical protein
VTALTAGSLQCGPTERAVCFRQIAAILVAIMAAVVSPSDVDAQDTGQARICPLPSTSEEILRLRLAITEYVEPHKVAPLAAWAMRAGHDEILDRWAKGRNASANEAKTEFSLAPLKQWLALGRTGSLPEIEETLASTVHAKARPVTGDHKYFRNGVRVDPPPVDHAGGAQRAAMSLVIASMLVHGRHAEAIERFRHSQLPGESLWHINFLIDAGELDRVIALYRKPPTASIFDARPITAIAYGLIRNRQLDRLAAFLHAELARIREHFKAKSASKELVWNAEEPVLKLLSRLGHTDWEPPDPLPATGQLSAVASLIAALRIAGREEDAERLRKRAQRRLAAEVAERKQRQAERKLPRVDHMLFATPSAAVFDLWIEIEHAYALALKGDLENAEKSLRPTQQEPFARFSRAAALADLSVYARHRKLWGKAEELLTLATRESLYPPARAPATWLAAAADAQQAGATDMAARWMQTAGAGFCRLDPDRREWFVSLPRSHPGYRKPFVLPYLDTLYVLTAVREGLLPTNAR